MLAPQLAQCAKDIHEGHGFFVVRGLDELRYPVEDSTVIYLGIASYVADKRGLQDKKGTVLSKTFSTSKSLMCWGKDSL